MTRTGLAEGWANTSLGDLLRRPPRYGINAAAVPRAIGTHTYLRITDINEGGRFSPRPKVGVRHPNVTEYLMQSDELVFARTGANVGKSYLYDIRDGDLVYAGFLINVAPDTDRLVPKFLALYAQTQEYWDWVARTSMRSGQPGINGREFAQLVIPVPDLQTQRSICAVFTDADNTILALERLIAKKQAMKQGMMQQLLTGQTRLPGFTEPWDRLSLREVALRIQDGTHFSPRPGGTDYRYITSRNIGRGHLRLDVVETISAGEHRKIFDRCGTTFGDLLITKDGANTGNAALNAFREEVSLLSSVAFIRADRRITNEGYIMQYLLSESGRHQVSDAMAGNAITRLTLKKIRGLQIPIPPVEEQTAISLALAEADDGIDVCQTRLAKAKAVKQGMMQELLTGRTRLPIGEPTGD